MCFNVASQVHYVVSFILFTLFICGGPDHLSHLKQCSGDLMFFSVQLVYSVIQLWKK